MPAQYFRQFFLIASAMAANQLSCHAQSCPWMTQGSAAKLLGGGVAATTQIVDDKQGSCGFARLGGETGYSLDVVVSHGEAGACPEGSTPIKGIGNEAQWCSLKRSSTETVERISSRVRDTFFTVTLNTRGSKDAGVAEEERHDILNQAAELVAGNLF